jgi:Protein of unknown function (DUF2934)
MKQNTFYQDRNHEPANTSRLPAAEELRQKEAEFAGSQDEVARRAYFTYLNHGSQQGHDVQHWLQAEAQLTEERNLTRVHGFHHKN